MEVQNKEDGEKQEDRKEEDGKRRAEKEKTIQIAKELAKKDMLLSPDAVDTADVDIKHICVGIDAGMNLNTDEKMRNTGVKSTSEILREKPLVITNDTLRFLENNRDINWIEFEKAKALQEKKKEGRLYKGFVEYLTTEGSEKGENEGKGSTTTEAKREMPEAQVQIIECHEESSKERNVQDFVDFFNARYKALEQMLRNRQELENLMTISRIKKKRERETVSTIGLVLSKEKTKNGNIIMTLEDQTGIMKVLFNKNKRELFESAEQTVLDEVIGVCGVSGEDIIFVNEVVRPDVPISGEKKSSPNESYAIFLSDLHVGSKNFLTEEFNRFLKWINAEVGSESQRDIARKIRYVFIAGDLIDGAGIYADQDDDLITKDVYEQYSQCAELLSAVPKHMRLIMCPGNHDAVRIEEPQPPLYKDIAAEILKLPNAVVVSNPAFVNIDASENFSGFNVLMYHGYSFDYYASDVDMIRMNGGYDRADLIMRFLLQRRHLAPSHSSTLYIPETQRDPLVITRVPDIFLTGHIHKCAVGTYKNTILISGSCWQSRTAFQVRVGHHPEPAKVPIMNLKTREVKILNFEK